MKIRLAAMQSEMGKRRAVQSPAGDSAVTIPQ